MNANEEEIQETKNRLNDVAVLRNTCWVSWLLTLLKRAYVLSAKIPALFESVCAGVIVEIVIQVR